ncbi:flagellar hook-basal body complex protein FliE [Alkalihalobacillus sp. AL-G]|uniref:flagellar hook-basal body complex protein FliE n=1 Tax=Alkalihalobacillus sp. AL-G TaxID=2926399 RepID=UPI00272B264B|nr:flagellar hook-basal body complex protein FliE [Alkalihalobacillus sp. AL-G]WLD95149.1 flagellar hook-basal body complex protein FliE [Alkalihalobacillus sp. AL-G]
MEPVQNSTILSLPKTASPNQARDELTSSFKDMLSQVNEAQLNSDAATKRLINGKAENLHNVMIAAEKASIMLHTAVEVRNKAIEAYKEVMRMQV